MPSANTQDYILIAAITAIEKYGIANVTTRRIAEEAKVNNAALHYYYGTKEILVEKALLLTIDKMRQDSETIFSENRSFPDRLRNLFEYLADGVLRFPNLFRAYLNNPLMEGVSSSPFLDLLHEWLQRCTAEFEDSLSDKAHLHMRMSFQTAVSALLFTGLIAEKSGFNSLVNFHNPSTRQDFIEMLTNFVYQQTSLT